MSEQTTIDSNKNVAIIVSPEQKAATPKYLGEIILILNLWIKTGLVSEINEKVKVSRARMGSYEVIDFSLLLLSYAISNERSLEQFSKNIKAFASAITVMWNRKNLPSTSALSRFLYDIKESAVVELRKVLFEDLITNGIGLKSLGGLYDHRGKRNIVFDVDATKAVARQRSLPTSRQYPELKRRRSSYKIGYKGRKRGEVVRSRTTVQQSHTNEWLGSFSGAGNGDIWSELQMACQVIVNYLKAHSISIDSGLVRLDGAYGWARGVYICNYLYGLGYLMRCSDYSFLKDSQVIKTVNTPTYVNFQHPDSLKVYRLYDVGFVDWYYSKEPSIVLSSRLIVVSSQAPEFGKKPSVGKLCGRRVYELFVTNLSDEQLTATELFELYCARGAFEQTLSQEDLEQNTDRFCSGNGFGQEFFQLISQWLWNARLAVGFAAKANSDSERRTLFCDSIPNNVQLHQEQPLSSELSLPFESCSILAPEVSKVSSSTNQDSKHREPGFELDSALELKVEYLSNKTKVSKKENSALKLKSSFLTTEVFGTFSDKDFLLKEDGTLICPAGNTLDPISHHQTNQSLHTLYQAKARDCINCHLGRFCKVEQSCLITRQVLISKPMSDLTLETQKYSPFLNEATSFENHLPNPSSSLKTYLPIYWDDLPSTSLRRFLPSLLHSQHLDIRPGVFSANSDTKTRVFSRPQRSHRRMSWSERLFRNQLSNFSAPWLFTFHSLPIEVSHYFNLISSKVA